MNNINVIGRLGRDPVVRYTDTQMCVTEISLGERYYGKNLETGNREKMTRWHNCVFFGKPAETLSAHASKGTQLAIIGALDYEKMQLDGGKSLKRAVIKGSAFELLGNPCNDPAEHPAPDGSNTGNFQDDDRPF